MLRQSLDDGVLTITLDRPDRLNALTIGLTHRLIAALRDAARDPGVRALILTGAGRGFCAGFDVRDGALTDGEDPIEAKWADSPVWNSIEGVAGRLIEHAEAAILLHSMPKPTIAMVRGAAAGSGLILAAACDFRIAAEGAVFKTAFAGVGRCGDPGGSYYVTKLVGPAMARELYMLDERIDAVDAKRIGLVNRVAADAELETVTQAFARRLADGPTLAYGYIKRNLNAAETAALEEIVRMEAYGNARTSMSRDAREATEAFIAKRVPRFEGM
ncbi:enoyl-CoA hydratase-related protein [Flavisphingomonas formosensis]|uniref:enoyl-CoA hydratase-related protein n=1 Tax=Flavisphingomonas formosensis TaxID=861534 RepID=UPI0012F7482B|nr:enoyl-CoA hydratase-related protein [Sphingomonas formosensis]